MVALLTDVARDGLIAYLNAQVPAQITAVNAARTGKHPLVPFATTRAAPSLAKQQMPALYIVAQKTGFRGAQWGSRLDEEHLLNITVEQANQDEETLEQDLIGYGAVIVNAIILWFQGAATLPNGLQFLSFDVPSTPDALDAVVYSPKVPEGPLYYAQVIVPVTMANSETS